VEELTAQRTAAMQAMLADNPKIALVAVVHALALECLYTSSSASCLKLRGSVAYLQLSAEGSDDSAASKQLAATTKSVTKGMPKQRKDAVDDHEILNKGVKAAHGHNGSNRGAPMRSHSTRGSERTRFWRQSNPKGWAVATASDAVDLNEGNERLAKHI